MTMLVKQLQAFNSHAVDNIERHKHAEAIEILSYAIERLCSYSLAPTPLKGPACTTVSSPNELILQIHTAFKPVACFLSENEGEELFTFPFNFDYELPLIDDDDEDDHDDEADFFLTDEQYYTCAVTMLFNLGLCHQLEWSKQRTSTIRLFQAIRMYDLVYTMVFDCCSDTTRDSMLEVAMGACVNLCHACMELANLEALKFWNDRLLRALQMSVCRVPKNLHRLYFFRCVTLNSFGWTGSPAA